MVKTTIDGVKPHKHSYKIGDDYTGYSGAGKFKHKHKISKDGTKALQGGLDKHKHLIIPSKRRSKVNVKAIKQREELKKLGLKKKKKNPMNKGDRLQKTKSYLQDK